MESGDLTNTDSQSLQNTVVQIKNILKPGGLFVGTDWFSLDHAIYKKMKFLPHDPYTTMSESEAADPRLHHLGKIHFTHKDQLKEIFTGFKFLHLEQKTYEDLLNAEIDTQVFLDMVVQSVAA